MKREKERQVKIIVRLAACCRLLGINALYVDNYFTT